MGRFDFFYLIIYVYIVFVVPQQGILDIITELGRMCVAPNEICVIPQGIRFAVKVNSESR